MGAAEVELVLVAKLELVVVVGGTVLDEMDWVDVDVGEGTVYIVVVATMLTFTGGGGGPTPGGGGAPGGGGRRPPGGGGGSCPSKIAVKGGGTTPTKEHSPVNQLEVACRSVAVQFALKHGTAFTKNPSPGSQTHSHYLLVHVLKGSTCTVVVVPVDEQPIVVKDASEQVAAQAGMPLEGSKSWEATWVARNKNA